MDAAHCDHVLQAAVLLRTDDELARYLPGAVGTSGALDGFLPASQLKAQYIVEGTSDTLLGSFDGGDVVRHVTLPCMLLVAVC